MVESAAHYSQVPDSNPGPKLAFESGSALLIAPEIIDPVNWGRSAEMDSEKLESFCEFLKIILSIRIMHAKFQIFLNFLGF